MVWVVAVRSAGRAGEIEHEGLAVAARPFSDHVGDDAAVVIGAELGCPAERANDLLSSGSSAGERVHLACHARTAPASAAASFDPRAYLADPRCQEHKGSRAEHDPPWDCDGLKPAPVPRPCLDEPKEEWPARCHGEADQKP